MGRARAFLQPQEPSTRLLHLHISNHPDMTSCAHPAHTAVPVDSPNSRQMFCDGNVCPSLGVVKAVSAAVPKSALHHYSIPVAPEQTLRLLVSTAAFTLFAHIHHSIATPQRHSRACYYSNHHRHNHKQEPCHEQPVCCEYIARSRFQIYPRGIC